MGMGKKKRPGSRQRWITAWGRAVLAEKNHWTPGPEKKCRKMDLEERRAGRNFRRRRRKELVDPWVKMEFGGRIRRRRWYLKHGLLDEAGRVLIPAEAEARARMGQ